MKVENVTPEQIIDAVVVLLAVFAAIITVDKVIDIIKKWRLPSTSTMDKLANDKARLDGHDKAILSLQESNKVLCAGIIALLDHELHNGNAEQMQEARDSILRYLQGNIGK